MEMEIFKKKIQFNLMFVFFFIGSRMKWRGGAAASTIRRRRKTTTPTLGVAGVGVATKKKKNDAGVETRQRHRLK